MGETTADVRRDIEMTRERISTTLAQLERKTNVAQIVRDHPWPTIAAAVGVGVLLSGTRADVKAAAATAVATKGASNKLGGVLDDAIANLMGGVHEAFQGHVDSLVADIKHSLGAPALAAGGGTRASLPGNTGAALRGDGAFGGSGTAGRAATASGASGAISAAATSGSASSGESGAWAPHTADNMSAASTVGANDAVGGPQRGGSQDYRTGRVG